MSWRRLVWAGVGRKRDRRVTGEGDGWGRGRAVSEESKGLGVDGRAVAEEPEELEGDVPSAIDDDEEGTSSEGGSYRLMEGTWEFERVRPELDRRGGGLRSGVGSSSGRDDGDDLPFGEEVGCRVRSLLFPNNSDQGLISSLSASPVTADALWQIEAEGYLEGSVGRRGGSEQERSGSEMTIGSRGGD
jgi:hypothetical protein